MPPSMRLARCNLVVCGVSLAGLVVGLSGCAEMAAVSAARTADRAAGVAVAAVIQATQPDPQRVIQQQRITTASQAERAQKLAKDLSTGTKQLDQLTQDEKLLLVAAVNTSKERKER